jgi:hypothetical protein
MSKIQYYLMKTNDLFIGFTLSVVGVLAIAATLPNSRVKAKNKGNEINLAILCLKKVTNNSDLKKVCEDYRDINRVGATNLKQKTKGEKK